MNFDKWFFPRTPLLLLILLTSNQQTVFAEPIDSFGPVDRIVIESCRLSSEKPHKSRHFPGTVNVSGRTTCIASSKGRALKVAVTLTRELGGNTFRVQRSATGFGQVIVNVSMPCIWQQRDAKIHYVVATTHKLSNGKVLRTENEADLEC